MIRTAVIGFGFMGVTHAKNIINSGNMELCGIVDNRGGDIFAGIKNTGNHGEIDVPVERLKETPVFKTLEECVEKRAPDAVIICVPLFLHYRICREALEKGMCVLLEKPFCSTPEEASELILLAEKKNKTLMVGHCVRFAPAWEYLASRIADKTFGELKLLSFERMGGEPAWGVWQDPEIKKTCGGSMLDLLIHDIDFAGYTLGYPEEVKVNINMEEYWELELKYPGRPVKVSVKGGFLYKHTAFAVSFAATFEKGSVRYSSHQPEIIHTGSENGPGVKKLSGDAYVKEIEYFAECLLSGAKPEKCPPEDSLESLKICLETKKEASGR